MILEICANSFESAKIAQDGGAQRIELCTNLAVGGLTPSRSLIKQVISQLEIPIHVLIRPRAGDFNYSTNELELMIADIHFCKEIGCAGVVSGVLCSEAYLDLDATRKLVSAAAEMEFTFHRAFDVAKDDLESSIHSLNKLGVHRLLSSGRQATAIEGIEVLKDIKNLSQGQFEVMPGSGINSTNAAAFKEASFGSMHLSAVKKSDQIKSNSFFDTGVEGISDLETILEISRLLS